jgi:hypothetical protein
MGRFGTEGNAGQADAIASLALLRALTQVLLASGDLIPRDIEKIREIAHKQIQPGSNDVHDEACRLIRSEFP